jgi:8-oxo-dGTP pyrophosphatase MutT (NUDIX family)
MIERTDGGPPYAALRELEEETGYRGVVNVERASLDVTRSPSGLVYWSFGGKVPREFRPKLNAEHTDAGWFSVDALPAPLHPGVVRLLVRLGLV